MTAQYYCKNKDRWKKVKGNNSINGIDYLEIPNKDQMIINGFDYQGNLNEGQIINVYFLHNLKKQFSASSPESPPVDFVLTKDNIFIEGGVRIKNLTVENIIFDDVKENLLHVFVDRTGDFSTYQLKIGVSITDKNTPPSGFDNQLSAIEFSFKINCPSEFDCKKDINCPPEIYENPVINYLARDYSSLKGLLLDRLSIIMPDWKERNAADLQVALIELLAYLGDHLSYYQDALATEAYLGTARRRVSLKRHARLLDYFVHDGCNARTWVHLEVEPEGNADGMELKAGTVLMTNGDFGRSFISEEESKKFIPERVPVIFETMHKIKLNSHNNTFHFYTWENNDCCLPKGSTSATLICEDELSLKNGDILIFEELFNPLTGKEVDKNIYHRHAVRIKTITTGIVDRLNDDIKLINIDWFEQDALPFSLCLSSSIGNKPKQDSLYIGSYEKCIARGNVVLADHGHTQKGKKLYPESASDEEIYYPKLPDKNISVAVPYDHLIKKTQAAIYSIKQDAHEALPSISLTEDINIKSWKPQKDLLSSDRFAHEFVVETEKDGSSYARFGNDILGKKPPIGFNPRAIYRFGNGKEGNIGAESINTIVLDGGGISRVRNPIPATGGINMESKEEIRQFAPEAFRKQERAIIESDYVEKTELYLDVQKARAKFYWTGSWYTVYIIIDRKGGKEVDNAYKKEIITHLEKYRMAGYDLEIKSPNYVPLSIILNVCVKKGYFKSNVKQSLLEAFSNYDLPNGSRGFFHPDNFTFGQAVYLSSVYKKAMHVKGVESVEITEFNRWAKISDKEIETGLIQPSELEILRLDNDPNYLENGRIEFVMLGGL